MAIQTSVKRSFIYWNLLYLVLCGESLNDRDGIRGGDTALSAAGLTYVQAALSTLQR